MRKQEAASFQPWKTAAPFVSSIWWGSTLQYELSYTNILNMLDLGAYSPFGADRSAKDPFVVGGGPCAFNPGAPWRPF